MPTESHGSVTHWLGALKAGDLAAAQPMGLWGNLGDGGEIDPMLVQRLTAAGTDRLGQSDLDRWSGPLIGPGQGAVGEASLARLASRAFGLGFALALGEGGGL